MSRKLFNNQFRFYVYAYLRETDSITAKKGSPYYIGKGQGNRAVSKHSTLNVPKNKNNIVYLECNLSEVGALALEKRYINWYGRKCNNTGILHNISKGGHGGFTNIYIKEIKERPCLMCGTSMIINDNKNKLCCCKLCKQEWRSILYPRKSYNITCPCCNTSKVVYSKTQVYCSVSCNAKTHRKTPKLNQPKYKFKEIISNNIIVMTSAKLREISGMSRSESNHLTHGIKRIIKGWTIWDINLSIFRNEITRKIQKPQLKIICEHCGLAAVAVNYKRWHGSNCKIFTKLILA